MKQSPPQHTNGLETPVQFSPKVGPHRAMLLKRLYITTVRDLFLHFPRGYEDHHTMTPIQFLKPGSVYSVRGTVVSVSERKPRGRSRVRNILEAYIEDAGGTIEAIWFNQAFLKKQLKEGTEVVLHGKVELKKNFLQLSSPKILPASADPSPKTGIVPLYPLTEGITQAVMQDIVYQAFERFSQHWHEFLPAWLLDDFQLFQRVEAMRIMHFPQPNDGAPLEKPDEQDLLFDGANEKLEPGTALRSTNLDSRWSQARYRLVFEEFLLHQYLLQSMRGRVKQLSGISHPTPAPNPLEHEITEELNPENPKHYPALFVQSLPFEMTDEQKQVCQEILADMAEAKPMNRLLQGDVGSGKTVVCLYAMMTAVASGFQAVMMAPTDLLAQQHFQTLLKFTKKIKGLRVAFLSGKSNTRETNEALLAIKTGAADIVVGTHSLFQERVDFANLGLAVVDEQHKFGVNQRQQLVEKGKHPDLLIATATPIPRTLSLTSFGDMDVSSIRSLPPGRPPIVTRWTHWNNEHKIWDFADEKIDRGQQMYVVCPIISASENMPQLPSTEDAFINLCEEHFQHRRVAMLHGKLTNDEKTQIMQKLRDQEIDIVVSTTVVEVGVDLPNATVMVVLGAERFGLAQLHQLRGRVGRGTEKSYFIMVTAENIAPYAQERMKALEKTRDGFKLAEEDLRLRGPGEIFGTRQSGEMMFKIGDPVMDQPILQDANQAAKSLYTKDPHLELPENQAFREEITQAFDQFEFQRPA